MVDKSIETKIEITDNGFRLEVDKIFFPLSYHGRYWERFDAGFKEKLASAYSFVRVRPLAMILNRPIKTAGPDKDLRELVDFGMIGDLPRVADIIHRPVEFLISSYKKSSRKIEYSKAAERTVAFVKTLENRVVIPMSFGKDSLLTYGLARELKFKRSLVFVQDTDNENKFEYEHKFGLIKQFEVKNKEKIEIIVDDIDEVFYQLEGKGKIEELENANAMLAFALELLPIAAFERARYIALGNEQNLNDSYMLEGRKAYPSFDQSAAYTKRLNKYLGGLTSDSVFVASLVEPLYNIAEMKILYNRYPDLLPFIMSCTITIKARDRWCYDCAMCAKAFLYASAFGDPRLIGMYRDMFEKAYEKLYPLFVREIKRPYEKPKAVRDEQLLAFLLAYRRGASGYLIEKFRKLFLTEAEKREAELRRKFFKIYKSNNIPKKISHKLNKIFQEELSSLL
jgi:hypothetical protein